MDNLKSIAKSIAQLILSDLQSLSLDDNELSAVIFGLEISPVLLPDHLNLLYTYYCWRVFCRLHSLDSLSELHAHLLSTTTFHSSVKERPLLLQAWIDSRDGMDLPLNHSFELELSLRSLQARSRAATAPPPFDHDDAVAAFSLRLGHPLSCTADSAAQLADVIRHFHVDLLTFWPHLDAAGAFASFRQPTSRRPKRERKAPGAWWDAAEAQSRSIASLHHRSALDDDDFMSFVVDDSAALTSLHRDLFYPQHSSSLNSSTVESNPFNVFDSSFPTSSSLSSSSSSSSSSSFTTVNNVSSSFSIDETPCKLSSPALVYIQGEEMTRYIGELILDQCVRPFVDISSWEFYDLSVPHRRATSDQVLEQCAEAGRRLCVVCKEPTVTPTTTTPQPEGDSRLYSANVFLRQQWNAFVISRDTIHVPGLRLGFSQPVLFDRQAVGGEYEAFSARLGRGTVEVSFRASEAEEPALLHAMALRDRENELVVYQNPQDQLFTLAHHFFSRCLEARVRPMVVTKRTVFKWQERFWQGMKTVFDEHYRRRFQEIFPSYELQHLLTDAASMAVIRWREGGFGLVSHNYDGDILTDEIAQLHLNPGFCTSVLTGTGEDGRYIKQFEVVHGTAPDLWQQHLQGETTDFNPLAMFHAVVGAMRAAATMSGNHESLLIFCDHLIEIVNRLLISNFTTRDIRANGSSPQVFIQCVSKYLFKIFFSNIERERKKYQKRN